jgi:NADH dehydrogenase FAD-containing subunit
VARPQAFNSSLNVHGSKKTMKQKTRIIIFGGGFCGSTIATNLDKHKEIEAILIDKNPYFEYTPGLPKLIRKTTTPQKIQVKYIDFLKHVSFVQEQVITITSKTVTTTTNTFSYDYLIICPGITYPIPFKDTTNLYTLEKNDSVQKLPDTIRRKHHIIIIGGGVVGVEVAAEIATFFPKKSLSLIHPKDRLIERNSPYASQYAHLYLKNHHVNIIYNEKIKNVNKNTFYTNNGKTINADIGIWCGGIKSDTSFMENFPESVFTQRNTLQVNQYLQLKGYDTIFVGGDITSIPEEKTAYNADRHADLIYKNILQSMKNKPLKSYRIIPRFLVISLGKTNGIISLPYFIIPGPLTGLIKWLIEKISLISRH